MRRTAAALLAVAVVVLGVDRLNAAPRSPQPTSVQPDRRVAPVPLSPLVPGAFERSATPLSAAPARAAARRPGADDDEVGVARRSVGAMWTRQAGDSAFAWLERVADITAPGLAAQLRTALTRPTDRSVVSATVDVDGVYPDAVDHDTLTVTCVAHVTTLSGTNDEPCATTVTVTPGPGGRLLVSAVA